MKNWLISLFISLLVYAHANPVVSVDLPGLLGNRLFAYCVAKIVAENMEGGRVHCKPIWGFPETYSCMFNIPSHDYPQQIIVENPKHFFNFTPIINNKKQRNIELQGYFISYQYLHSYADQIRNDWLKIDPELLLPKKKDSIVVHVRAEYPDIYHIPFEYYQKALAMASYDQVYICTDNPAHPFLKNFEPYSPIIVSTRNITQTLNENHTWDEIAKLNMDDFLFMLSFDKIIIGVSTYSWWAAFLSDAQEVYAPDNYNYRYLKVQEDRYHYIATPIGT